MTAEAILDALSPAQRLAAETVSGPLLIKAGPGSGKTRTITHRIAYAAAIGAHDPARSLALTFTTRAAGELRRRLRDLGAGPVTVRTFHSAALRQLRHFWPDAVGGTPARVDTDRAGMLATAAARQGIPDDPDTVTGLLAALDWLKAHLRTATADGLAGAAPVPGLDAEAVAKVLTAYEDVKSERGVIDFDDVLLVTIGLLDSRTDMRESVRRAFRWITVDEYQDVSPVQQRLLDLWVGDRHELCAVGDAAQAIYEFAGADPELIATFARRYRGATVVELDETYRCARAIAKAANGVAGGPAGASPGGRIDGAVRLRPAGPAAVDGAVQVLQFPTGATEAAGIADEIAGLIRGGARPSSIACLARTNQQVKVVADELRRRRIPFSARGGDRFYSRPEVSEAVVRFRGEVRAHPGRPAAPGVAAVFTAMGHDAEPPDAAHVRDRWESLAALGAMLEQEPGDAADVLARLEERVAEQDPPDPAGVGVLTLHAAKGLEWDTVFVVGADDTLLPLTRAVTARALAEERRLAYVGFTRARTRLVVSWASQGPRGERRGPSPYLAALRAGSGEPVAVLAPPLADLGEPLVTNHSGESLPPARCRVCHRALVTGVERVLGRCGTCPSEADAGVLAALTSWRDRVADQAEQPPHAVLTDVILLAIAEQRPGTLDKMASIPGLRPDKLARFGTDLLTVVHSAPVVADPPAPTPSP